MDTQIFIMDDEPAFGELISDVAEMLKIGAAYLHQPELFESELSKYPDTQLIFLDLHMPGRDGVELIRSLAERNYTGAIVLMSGYDEGVLGTAYDLAEAHELKLLPTLKKPFSIQDLKNLINEFKSSFFHQDESQNKPKIQDQEMEADEIRQALEESRLILHYQPQINLKNYEVIGFESLARIKDRNGQLIYPNRFIDAMEANGLNELFLQRLLERLEQDYQTYFKNHPNFTISINVSALDLNRLDFPDTLASHARVMGIEPQNLIIEITESSAIQHLKTGLDILARLRLKGFKLSIDDFGTGTAVLENIKRMPFTELKIDRVFIEKLSTDKRLESLTGDTIQMARHLNLIVVAEGIENLNTVHLLQNMGCDIAQGYFFAKPMCPDGLFEFLQNHRCDDNTSVDIKGVTHFFIDPNTKQE
ncbi:EAL domain-containing response regulator [Thiomicrorhabdus sp. ZW0627]|uniref:EAL domain-containing response regulator n=1 Tax=Thiomicrorhabdus sp. ZW0627 TaxID=3039774 RepID=UPI002436D634|nr:EAL domain-containing response regulator [Thiomicrorhabdus sp. ZW0627]MDG6773510.1 EAL domain-containing response regulator [Thiomicrorhabdus sp. ZW0627]